jgi:spore maturation protein CgeB
LHNLGHQITFYEPDAYSRQEHRDIPDPDWAQVVVYPANNESDAYRVLEKARGSDVVIKASGVGVFDDLLERGVLDLKNAGTRVVYWDVDAPATIVRMRANPSDHLAPLVPRFDMVLTYGGGHPVVEGYAEFGARRTVPIYNALDPETHYPVAPNPRFAADLSFLGNRLPDREARVDEFFLKAATMVPQLQFVLGGSGWHDKSLPPNVRYKGHIFTGDHNAFNSSPRAVLNVARDSMAQFGYSPATRVFEAAGAAACIVTDAWEGIDMFLDPGNEILVAANGEEVAELAASLTPTRAREIGERARLRVLAEHTYAHRAGEVEALLLEARTAQAGGAYRGV